MTIFSVFPYASNAELIEAARDLGYLRSDWLTLDPTYGYGTFWKNWKPTDLICQDLKSDKAPHGVVDFCNLPYADMTFDAVVFDPPYKLSGKPALAGFDERYGVDQYVNWKDRMKLILNGTAECARVTRKFLLVKCMDQVVSGERRWQTREIAEVAEAHGFKLVDQLNMLITPRPQPGGRSQKTSLMNVSTMNVLKRVHGST